MWTMVHLTLKHQALQAVKRDTQNTQRRNTKKPDKEETKLNSRQIIYTIVQNIFYFNIYDNWLSELLRSSIKGNVYELAATNILSTFLRFGIFQS